MPSCTSERLFSEMNAAAGRFHRPGQFHQAGLLSPVVSTSSQQLPLAEIVGLAGAALFAAERFDHCNYRGTVTAAAAAAGVRPPADAADNLQRFHYRRYVCSAGSTDASS